MAETIDPDLLARRVGVLRYVDKKHQGKPKLWVKRYKSRKLVRIGRGDKVFVGDELSVDKNAVASIELTLGGRSESTKVRGPG